MYGLINKFILRYWLLVMLTVGLCVPVALKAQTGISPYSRQGIGEPVGLKLMHNDAMGGVGLSNPENFHLNLKNPAMLYMNSLSIFEGSAGGEFKKMQSSESSGQVKNGQLNYLAFAFPAVSNWWTFSFGLMPYSRVGYKSTTSRPIENTTTPVNVSVEGTGGINQVYFANGIRITKNFSVGIRARYLFGAILEDNTHELASEGPGIIGFKGTYHQRTHTSDFLFGGGFHYRINLKENSYLNLGATYDLSNDINTTRLITLERRDNVDSNLSKEISEESGNITIPEKYGFGISYQAFPQFTVGSDITYQKWSGFKNFNGSNEGMNDSYEIGLGTQWIPDPSSVDNYFARMSYLFGLNFEQTPFTPNNQTINDFSINAGFGFPIGELSYFNLTMEYGSRGTTQNNLILEQYFGLQIGVSYNDRWFVQPKYQ